MERKIRVKNGMCWNLASVLTSILFGIFLTGCGQEDTGGYSDIFAETEQISDLTEEVNTSEMISYEYLGSRYYQSEKVQIWGERQIDGCRIYLHKEDGSRELLAENISPFEMDKGWWIDDQKRCYYKKGSALVGINDKGEKIFTTELEEGEFLRDICQLADGRIVAAIYKDFETRLRELNPDSGKLNAIVEQPLHTGALLIAPSGEGLILLDHKGLWNVNLTDGGLSNMISFEGTSYTLQDDIYRVNDYRVKEDIRLLEDGSAELLWSDGTSEFLRLAQVGEGKEILTLRFMFSDSMLDSWMKEQIVLFNQRNNDYYITIEEMPDGTEMADFRERTDMELGTGKGADIICCYALNDACSLLNKGAFVDLAPFMEASNIREEDYFPAAFSGWKDGNKIYSLSCMVYASGCWVDTAVAGDSRISSVEELMDCLLAYEGDGVAQYTSQYILRSFLENSESLCGMVDFENSTCDFGGELFGKLLEAAKRYGWDQSKASYLQVTGNIRYRNFYNFADNEHLAELGKIPVGYFFDDGGHTKAETDAMLAINANSRNKEGAWEFLKFLLSEEVQSTFSVDVSSTHLWKNYPVDRGVFEKLCKDHEIYYEEGYRVAVKDGSDEMLVTGLTEKRKEELKTALEDARYAPLWTKPLIQIIVEEANAYFSGDKSIDEVRSMVQNRVQLYLNEMN